MNNENVKMTIVEWMRKRAIQAGVEGFVVGVSGGIDSAVTSTLAAHTGLPVLVLNMPIKQASDQFGRSNEHIEWLCENFNNVKGETVDLYSAYDGFRSCLGEISELADANLKSRIRMCCLYSRANTHNYMVAGTGNKVEDYGVGFFTKYGDGGVDISPIADLVKSEVYELGGHMGICHSILTATPTDGLWGDNRGDEDQIGATYDELEWALAFCDANGDETRLTDRQTEVLNIYKARHYGTKHKLEMPPVCEISESIKG